MIYTLKDNSTVESQPIGRSSVKIGETNLSGFLTICDRGPNLKNSRGATVICKCKCGKYTLIKLQSFKDGSTKSCGCYNKEQKQEICKIIGHKQNFKNYSDEKFNINPYYNFIEPTNDITPYGRK